MALGENIGYSAWLSQNNKSQSTGGLYLNPGNYSTRGVHITLLGDLSLRTDYIKPPTNIVLTNPAGAGAKVTWAASPDVDVIGYYVYRSATEYGKYDLRSGLVTGTTYTDSTGTDGNQFYMVRAAKLQSTPSGSYYNLSIGYTDSEYIIYPPTYVNNTNHGQFSISLYPNPAKDKLNVLIPGNNKPVTLQLTDTKGNQIKSYKVTGAIVQLNLPPLASGTYYLNVIKTDGSSSYKIVIQ